MRLVSWIILSVEPCLSEPVSQPVEGVWFNSNREVKHQSRAGHMHRRRDRRHLPLVQSSDTLLIFYYIIVSGEMSCSHAISWLSSYAYMLKGPGSAVSYGPQLRLKRPEEKKFKDWRTESGDGGFWVGTASSHQLGNPGSTVIASGVCGDIPQRPRLLMLFEHYFLIIIVCCSAGDPVHWTAWSPGF